MRSLRNRTQRDRLLDHLAGTHPAASSSPKMPCRSSGACSRAVAHTGGGAIVPVRRGFRLCKCRVAHIVILHFSVPNLGEATTPRDQARRRRLVPHLVTEHPAPLGYYVPTEASSPTVTSPAITAPGPIHTRSPMLGTTGLG